MNGFHEMMIAAAALIFMAGAAHAQETRNYYCGDGQGHLRVTIISQQEIRVVGEFPGAMDDRIDMVLSGGGDGPGRFRFFNQEYSAVISGPEQDTLHWSAPDFGEIFCVWGDDRSDAGAAEQPAQAAGDLPTPGRSCGGKVRAAPNLDSQQIGSLQNGDPITILERAGAMDGYSWFRIRFGSRTGYQWGGILSSASDNLPDAFVGC